MIKGDEITIPFLGYYCKIASKSTLYNECIKCMDVRILNIFS